MKTMTTGLSEMFPVNPKEERLKKQLTTMIDENGQSFWEAFFSLVSFYQHFGFCQCGRMPATLNVGKSNFMYCKRCKTYWLVGGNLLGGWEKKEKTLQGAREIEEQHLYLSFSHSGLMSAEEVWKAIESDCRRCRQEERENEAVHQAR